MKRIVIFFAALACICSCSTYQYSSRQVYVNNQNIVASPTVVDVKVDYTNRITERSGRCKTLAEAMEQAKYNAITKNNIDILVDMIYKTEMQSNYYIVTVTGFAGYYTNSRSLYEDIKQLENIKKEDIEKYLIIHNPEVLQYMNQQNDVVNIYHNENKTK